MTPIQEELPQKPSFLRSSWEGIKGFFKGGIAGMAIGAVLVGGVAAAIGAIFPDIGADFFKNALGSSVDLAKSLGVKVTATEAAIPTISAISGVGHGAGAALGGLAGAFAGANLLGSIGMLTGAVTGVVKSREAAQPSAEDVVNLAKIAFAQGVGMGQQMGIAQSAAPQPSSGKTAVTAHQDRLKEREVLAMAQASQLVH